MYECALQAPACGKVAVFLDGDFWHGWRFGRWEIKLQPFWRDKIARNRARDASNFAKLRRQGWKVLRIWEHELEHDLARQVERIPRRPCRPATRVAVSPEAGTQPPSPQGVPGPPQLPAEPPGRRAVLPCA